jgi:hypothetical protein
MHRIRLIFRSFDRFLLSCSGGRPDVLEMEVFHGQKHVHRSVGITVLFCSVVVAFSIGYATFLISSSTIISIIAALVMGLIFLHLQKLLMHVFDRYPPLHVSRTTLTVILTSVSFGGVFAVVLSLPIELGLFAHEIDARIPANATSSLLERFAILKGLKSEYPVLRWVSIGTILLHFMIFISPLWTRWLMPVNSAYLSYLRHEEDEVIKEIDMGSVNAGVVGARSEEIMRALDDASKTAERIISSLDESHEILRRSFASKSEENG